MNDVTTDQITIQVTIMNHDDYDDHAMRCDDDDDHDDHDNDDGYENESDYDDEDDVTTYQITIQVMIITSLHFVRRSYNLIHLITFGIADYVNGSITMYFVYDYDQNTRQ